MKCKQCEAEGLRSKVFVGRKSDGQVYVHLDDKDHQRLEVFYDEDGAYHCHDENPIIKNLHCSNGHDFTETYPASKCRACVSSDNPNCCACDRKLTVDTRGGDAVRVTFDLLPNVALCSRCYQIGIFCSAVIANNAKTGRGAVDGIPEMIEGMGA